MTITLIFIGLTVVSYLMGSANGAIIVSKIYNKGDIRDYGSGNAGSTNVLRSVGKSAALFTFIFDILKGVLAVVLAILVLNFCIEDGSSKQELINIGKNLAGVAAVMGHVFPVFYGFKGGKGVATSAAVIGAIDWRVLIFVLLVFIISFAIKKIVSLSSMLGAITYPIATFFITYFFDLKINESDSKGFVSMEYLIFVTIISSALGAFVVIKHKDNIKRLLKGEEKAIIGKNK
ncbi:MAG: glycerol-3-phosphate 1-O-acyltransferase PlsY [Clostridia bacterium]